MTVGKATISIIGSGPGGLATAMILAGQGYRVRVFEKTSQVGGRCSAIEAEGFRFDRGPTFFLYPRVLEEIFREVGRELFDEVPMTRLDPQYRVDFASGGHLDATPDHDRMEEQIRRINASDANSFKRFMNDNRTKLQRFRPILESPFQHPWDLLRPSVIQALPWLRPHNSVARELRRYFRDPRLVIAFSFQAKYLGMSPFRCPSLFSILSYLEYEHGVYHPQGGCNAVSLRMADIAKQMGVEFHMSEPVQQLELSGRRVTGLRTVERSYPTDGLVINADFAKAVRHLVPNTLRKSWSNRRIDHARFSCSTFMLYLGIRGSIDLPHHTIHIAEDYEKNVTEITNTYVLPTEPSIYIQNASATDDTLAPTGCSTLYVLVPVPNQKSNIDWTIEGPAFRKLILQKLAALGIDQLEDRIVYEQITTPEDWDTQFDIHQGATFNLAHDLRQMLHRRPRNRYEDLDGVYLVGGGTHPGSGLPVIYESARISSRLIQQDVRP